jgi:hypothetical protein
MIRRTTFAALTAATLLGGCGPGSGADPRSLASVAAEPSGDNCPAGGQKIITGIDANGNGILEASEVQQVAYVCNGHSAGTCTTLEGSIVIRNSFDWANLAAAGCTRITGDLEIYAPGAGRFIETSPLVQVGALSVHGNDLLGGVRFPNLTTVDRGMSVTGNPSLTELQLPALATVGVDGLILSAEPAMTDLDMPALTAVGGDLDVYGSTGSALGRVNLPSLASVGGHALFVSASATSLRFPSLVSVGVLVAGFNQNLTELDLPVLETTAGLELDSHPLLVRLDLPALTTLGTLWITGNPALTIVSMPALRELNSTWDTRGTGVLNNNALVTWSTPALTRVASLSLSSPALTTIDLSSLATVTEHLSIFSPRLASLDLPALTTAGSPDPGGVSVAAGLSIDGAALTRLGLPVLATAGALSVAGGPDLVLELPELTFVDGNLSMSRDGAGVRAPKLTSVTGDLHLFRLERFSDLSVPVLTTVGGLKVATCSTLTSLSFPALTELRSNMMLDRFSTEAGVVRSSAGMEISDDPELASIDLPVLASVGEGDLWFRNVGALRTLSLPALTTLGRSLSLERNPALTSVRLAALTALGGNLTAIGNPVLERLDLPALTSVGTTFNGSVLSIHDNPALPQCLAEAILAGLVPPLPVTVNISNNDPTGTCP